MGRGPSASTAQPAYVTTSSGGAELLLTDSRVGGVMDDSTNNTPALNAAVDLLGARGGTIAVPAGIARFTTQPDVIPSNITIKGVGKNASVLRKVGSFDFLRFEGTSNSVRCQRGGISDIQINGNTTSTGKMVTGKWADHLNFDRVWFNDQADGAIRFENVWDSYFSRCEFDTVSGSDGFKPSVLIVGNADDSSNIIVFNGCRWEAFIDGALWVTARDPAVAYTMVTGTNPPYGIWLTDCKIETPQLRGLMINMSSDIEDFRFSGGYISARGLYTGITTGRTLISMSGAADMIFERIHVQINGSVNPTVAQVFYVFSNAYGSLIRDIYVDAVQLPSTGMINWAGGIPDVFVENVRYKTGQAGTIHAGSGTNAIYPTVASSATITVLRGAKVVNVTGTTTITSVTAGFPGQVVTLKFAGILTFTDGSNLKLAGDFVTSADDTIMLGCDGTNWYEIGRSAN
jgi:hypothetical protein